MSNKKFADLVERLIASTQNQSIHWNETSQGNIFQVSFKDYSVQIVCTYDDENTCYYRLRIVNENGEVVDEISTYDLRDYLPSAYSEMEGLFSLARRNALGVDKALDSILDQLDLPF